jgi:hypothetical protein
MARAFGSTKKNLYQSDYIAEKSSGKKIYYNRNINISNKKTDLSSGLYYKMDMSSVCSLVDGLPFPDIVCDGLVSINTTLDVPFYISNTIYPLHLLYNNDKCVNPNYMNYMVLNSNS